MSERALIIGTRGSHLALEQARRVQNHLAGPSEIRIIKTSGDRFTDKPLHEQGGVGLFTKEIESELRSGGIDLAVHSLKDLPTQLGPGLVLGAVLARDAVSDLLLVRPDARREPRGGDPTDLPLRPGARVGASSLRRQALIRSLRPDLEPAAIRGNVPTRVDKVRSGEFDAIVLSRAGLERLALPVDPLIGYDLNPARWPGAPGQGTIAVEVRADDPEVLAKVAALDDAPTRRATETERTLLVTYGGGCHAPFGAWASETSRSARLFVAAPAADGGFVIASFGEAALETALAQAQAWIRAGCARPGQDRGEDHDKEGSAEWICRPAQPWC